MNDNTRATSNVGQFMENDTTKIITKLDNLNQRIKQRNLNDRFKSVNNVSDVTVNTVSTSVPDIVPEEVINPSSDSVVDVLTNKNVVHKTVEPPTNDNQLKLRINTVFTVENMYEQVKKDYFNIIQQSIDYCLDDLTLFYMQGNKFKENKDMKIFLNKKLQHNIFNLRSQYINKYTLINGLTHNISLVEKQESQQLKSMTSNFINRMINNTFN